MNVQHFLNQRFFGNTVGQFMVCGIVLLLGFLLRRLLSRIVAKLIYRLTKKYTAGVSEQQLNALLIQPLSVVLFLFTLFLAFNVLDYPVRVTDLAHNEPWLKKAAFRLYQMGVIWAMAWVVLRLIDFAELVYRRRAEFTTNVNTRLDAQFIPFAKDFLKVLVLIFAFLVMLGQVFAVNVTALIGGLGIGGLAVAFAAKESLENLIASFTIFLDRPFQVGELVTVGGITGTVEKIGFRSTRLRTAEKSYVTVPNRSMIDKPLDNLSLRTARRVTFTLNFSHDTTREQLLGIATELRQYLLQLPNVVPEEVQIKLAALTQSGRDVSVQYFVQVPTYDEYLDVKEEVNYRILEIVEAHGGTFATNTTVVRMLADPGISSGTSTGSTIL
ncbi:mechanosensitive ion channel family protein [Hymenobacter busanensis]|uniref:Mechanosensitive ion channel family protein n=1 Tax=Hymenobacter busanensis TaxID=2607656 RepID=A0A7L4ZY68_9BACT|nr:mechanosensitive ion channel family protein [Hymenobacter busanensis]KAA9331298.1 mechanosensitive ion channel family protein [Hymenobacter busanensis]QHJ08449.1 mechanosensitive ion channel [Hymenobacter busanensis]